MRKSLNEILGSQAPAPQPKSQGVKPLRCVRVYGVGLEALCDTLSQGVVPMVRVETMGARVSAETMQEDQHREAEAVLNLFVVQPRVTGYAGTAAAAAEAVRNPESTGVLIMSDVAGGEEPLTEAEHQDIAELQQTLTQVGTQVYTSPDNVIDSVNVSALTPEPAVANA